MMVVKGATAVVVAVVMKVKAAASVGQMVVVAVGLVVFEVHALLLVSAAC